MLKRRKKSSGLRTLSGFLRTFALVKKKLYIALLLAAFTTVASAQTEAMQTAVETVHATEQAVSDSVVRPKLTRELLDDARREDEAAYLVDLPLGRSPLADIDRMPTCTFFSPWSYGGPTTWRLHEGFNAEVGFSVSGSFGKNRIKGAGFGEHFAAAYAMPFGKDKRWIGAVGLYADRLDWGSYHRTEAGIAGVLGYNVNDWCNLYVYGAYNFVPGVDNGPNPYALRYPYWGGLGYMGYGGYGCGYPFDPYANLRGRIGGAAEFKVGNAATITVAFEHDFYDKGPSLPVVPPQPDNHNKPFGVTDSPNSAGGGGNWRR